MTDEGMHGSTDEQLDEMEMRRWRMALTWIGIALLIFVFFVIVGGIQI